MLVLAGCAKGGEPAEQKIASGAAVKNVLEFFPLTVGGHGVRVQLAVTMDEMQHGLMGRRDLGPDDAMIFVYPAPTRMSFWMRNTPTPLDIGFFTADGKLGEVYQMYAFDETPVKSTGTDYTLALELNQGWFAKNGVKPGAQLDLGQLAAALRARGFKPERYGVIAP
ncbi:MAG: DUF192 domain-containing protein [Verrucomicrobia bacterium]|nr:DUF192 domain-containing protein [Verrucomicrobiota bacterium]